MAILKMADLDLKGKRVLIRADLNVPLRMARLHQTSVLWLHYQQLS